MILTKTNTVNRNLDNVFNEIFNTLPYNWNRDTRNDSFNPAVNIVETPTTYELELNAAGRNKEDFKISVDKGLLTISFDQKQEAENKDQKVVRKEFSLRSFKRSFSLDEKINAEAIVARYENGILKVTLPKKEEVKPTPKQIEIQ